jgi:hypothetical protein
MVWLRAMNVSGGYRVVGFVSMPFEGAGYGWLSSWWSSWFLTDIPCCLLLWPDDDGAESALVSTIAATSDDVEEHHILNTTCVLIYYDARRRLEAGRRELGNASVEIGIDLFAPAETSGALGQAVIADVGDSIENGTFLTMLLSFASALNSTYFDSADVKDAYLIREPNAEPMLGFLDREIVVVLAASTAVGSISATVASSAVPAGDPLSLIFAIQFVSLTSLIDGLPREYVDTFSGTFGWYVDAIYQTTFTKHIFGDPSHYATANVSPGQTFSLHRRPLSRAKIVRRTYFTGTYLPFYALSLAVRSVDVLAPG